MVTFTIREKEARVMKKIVMFLIIAGLCMTVMTGLNHAFAQSQKEPIKIGLLVEKTGGLAAYGYSHEKVLQAAVSKVNKEGGIAGRPVEVYVEDTESKPSVGALKFRKLVETYGADFVLDSNHSGICIACASVAGELNIPYFPCGSATDISGDKGNRYVFQTCTNVRMEAKGAAKFAVENLGKKWVTVVVNFAWGWANEKDFTTYVTENGGTVLNSVRVPLGTGDWLPYLKGKIPQEAEAIYFANYGSDFLSFIRDLNAVCPDIEKLGVVYAFSAQDIKGLGAAAEGAYCLTSYPTYLEGLNTPNNKQYRELIGVDDEGKEIGTGKRFVLAYDWCVWEALFALKAAVEKSGWQSRNDHPKFIQTLEGMEFKESVEFPQGDMRYRKEDHLVETGLYVEQISSGTLQVVKRISAADAMYPPIVDRTKESF
jgi:branched-chain amino acid transport system substrate-binding protein